MPYEGNFEQKFKKMDRIYSFENGYFEPKF